MFSYGALISVKLFLLFLPVSLSRLASLYKIICRCFVCITTETSDLLLSFLVVLTDNMGLHDVLNNVDYYYKHYEVDPVRLFP